MNQAKLHNYTIEQHNIESNRWEIKGSARTLDEAFEFAETLVGSSKIHDDICIQDMQGFIVWESNGFRQGEGKKLPDWSEENPVAALDGSV